MNRPSVFGRHGAAGETCFLIPDTVKILFICPGIEHVGRADVNHVIVSEEYEALMFRFPRTAALEAVSGVSVLLRIDQQGRG